METTSFPVDSVAPGDPVVDAACDGDRDAFGRLAEREWEGCARLARAILASDLEVEDQVQDALVAAWRSLPKLRDRARFAAWLRRIVIRRCVRRARLSRWLPLKRMRGTAPSSAPETSSLDARRVLAGLSPRQRAVLWLGEFEGRPDAEIASLLGISASTVRAHRRQARLRIQERLP